MFHIKGFKRSLRTKKKQKKGRGGGERGNKEKTEKMERVKRRTKKFPEKALIQGWQFGPFLHHNLNSTGRILRRSFLLGNLCLLGRKFCVEGFRRTLFTTSSNQNSNLQCPRTLSSCAVDKILFCLEFAHPV